jgi:hypothetical protein
MSLFNRVDPENGRRACIKKGSKRMKIIQSHVIRFVVIIGSVLFLITVWMRRDLSDASTVTVYLVQPGRHHTKINHAMSAFRTDVLDRYGSGRLQFTIKEDPKCNFECTKSEEPQPSLVLAPCLAVSNQWTCDYKHLGRNQNPTKEIQMKLAKQVKRHQLEFGPKPTFARFVIDVVVEEKSFVVMILIRGEPLKSDATKMTKARRCQMIASSKDC